MKRNYLIYIVSFLTVLMAGHFSTSAQTELSGNYETIKLTEGSYKLTGNVYITGSISSEGTVTLDLNGYVIEQDKTKFGRALLVYGNTTIIDSRPNNPNTGNFGLKNVIRNTDGGIDLIEDGPRVTINGGIITSYGADRGGIIFMAPGSTLTFKGGTLAGGVAMHTGQYDGETTKHHAYTDGTGGAVFVNDGCTFIMDGGDIAYCCTSHILSTDDQYKQGRGGAVFVDSDGEKKGKFIMRGDSRIYGCLAARGGGVGVWASYNVADGEGGEFVMEGGIIEDCTAALLGGGVYVSAGSTCKISNGIIRNNLTYTESDYYGGAGIFINAKSEAQSNGVGRLTITGGTLTGNKTNAHGGAVYSKGIFNMLGGLITENIPSDWDGNENTYAKNTHGSGVYTLDATSVFTMTGGTISNNVSASGGGIMIWNNSTVIMKGGTISGNRALGTGGLGNGGAVYVQKGTFKFEGGELINNRSVRYGGAININSNSTLELTGGTISGNRSKYGGGVSQEAGECQMTINPGVTFKNNTADNDGGALFIEMGTVILDGCTITNNTANSGNGGCIALKAARVEGSIDMTVKNNAVIKDNTAGGNGGAISLLLDPTVQTDYPDSWTDNQSITVNLISCDIQNNHAYEGGALHIYAHPDYGTASMSVGSASAKPKFFGNTAQAFGGAIAMDNGEMTIVSGTFTNNKADGPDGYAGAVYLGNGNMTITNAEFTGNEANQSAGCVYVSGKLIVTGKIVIKDNIAGSEAGAVLVDGGDLSFADCEISGNSAGYDRSGNIVNSSASGGALSIRGGAVNIVKGDVVNNRSTLYGGGLFVFNNTGTDKTVNLLGNGTFENNKAVAGGGVYAAGRIIMNMHGNVNRNIATSLGGGIYLDNVTKMEFSGNVTFNIARNGGGILLNNSAMEITGGIIRNNQAVVDPSNPSAPSAPETKPQSAYMADVVSAPNLAGLGGGIYLNTGSTLVFNIEEDLGVYENDATWGADDIFANGNNTSVKIPDVGNMNLTGYRVPTTRLYWAEDYITNDSDYASGTALKPTYSTDPTNLRYDDAILDAKSVYILDFADGENYKVINKYLSLEVGYELIIVDIVKEGLKLGESATFILTPAKVPSGSEYIVAPGEEPYVTIIFVCTKNGQGVRRRIALPSGWWEMKETSWSWAYDNAPTIIEDVSRDKREEAGGKLVYTFVNIRKDAGDNPEALPESYEAVKINRMKSTKAINRSK